MKTTLSMSMLALGLMFSGAAFAETAKPIKPAPETMVDTITTQSIENAQNTRKCAAGFDNLNAMKACDNSSVYPANPLSGMNLGY